MVTKNSYNKPGCKIFENYTLIVCYYLPRVKTHSIITYHTAGSCYYFIILYCSVLQLTIPPEVSDTVSPLETNGSASHSSRLVIGSCKHVCDDGLLFIYKNYCLKRFQMVIHVPFIKKCGFFFSKD